MNEMAVHQATDGRRYVVRPIQTIDREHLVLGLGKMSPTTRFQRFHNMRTDFSDAELDFLVACDGKSHIAYVCRALDENGNEGEGVAVARFYRDPNNAQWGEVAIVVIDEWQNIGLGGVLLQTLSRHCRRQYVVGWRATIVGDNDRAVRAFLKIGNIVMREWQDRSMILHVELD